MFKAKATPSQTIGPFFHGATRWLVDLAVPRGDNVVVAGQVLDMDAKPVSDALLEVSQPASEESGLRFQRIFTDDDGRFQFRMPKPSSAPLYADVTTFARGLLKQVLTRVYIAPTSDAAHAATPQTIPAARRSTLVALLNGEHYRWNIRLRGEGETVFFDLE